MGALAGWMGEAESDGRGKGVMFGGGQRRVYVCICVWWWVEDTGLSLHFTLRFVAT